MRPVTFIAITLCILAHRSLAKPKGCNPGRDCGDLPESCPGGFNPDIPLGGCCPVCPQIQNCTKAEAECVPVVDCPGGHQPFLPPGECCVMCPELQGCMPEYNHGDSFYTDSCNNSCVCNDGNLVCTEKDCDLEENCCHY